jgi:hypothetical protein
MPAASKRSTHHPINPAAWGRHRSITRSCTFIARSHHLVRLLACISADASLVHGAMTRCHDVEVLMCLLANMVHRPHGDTCVIGSTSVATSTHNRTAVFAFRFRPTEPPMTARLFKRMARFGLVRHREDCSWRLARRWRDILQRLWNGAPLDDSDDDGSTAASTGELIPFIAATHAVHRCNQRGHRVYQPLWQGGPRFPR